MAARRQACMLATAADAGVVGPAGALDDHRMVYDSSDDGDFCMRSPDALAALFLLPDDDAKPNADAQPNGDLGHALLVGGDGSDSGGAASARALAGSTQHAATGGSGHLSGQRSDAQTNFDAQANTRDDDGRGQLLVTVAAAHRPRLARARALAGPVQRAVPDSGGHFIGQRHDA